MPVQLRKINVHAIAAILAAFLLLPALAGRNPAATAQGNEPVPMAWEEFGPHTTMTINSVLISNTFAISPSNPEIIYYNLKGSLYKSANGGTSWQLVSRVDSLYTNDFSLLVDCEDPNRIFALFKWGVRGSLHVSNDGGHGWSDLGLYLWDIAQSHQNPDLLYAVNYDNNTLMKSLDGGMSWEFTNVNAVGANPPSGYWQRRARILISPADDNRVYVSYYWNRFDAEPDWKWLDYGIIVRSVDGGQTCEKVYEGSGKLFASIASTDSDIIYASGCRSESVPDMCIRSLDGGDSWENVDAGIQAKVYGPLAIDPVDPQTIYLTAYTDFFGPFTGSDWDSYVMKSADGGQTWAEIETGLPTKGFYYELWLAPACPQNLYVIDIISGVYKSTDAGDSWVSASNGIHPYTDILSCDPVGSMVLCANGNSVKEYILGGAFRSYDGGGSWNSVMNLGLSTINICDIAITPGNPDRVFASSYQNGPFLGGLWLSEDGGASWLLAEHPPGYPWSIGQHYGWGVSRVAIAPSDPETVYALVTAQKQPDSSQEVQYIYRSPDGGNSWYYMGTAFDGIYSNFYSLAVDAENKDTLYAVAGRVHQPNYPSSYGLMRSTDGGATWTEIGPPANYPTAFMSVVTDLYQGGIVYLAGRGPENYPVLFKSSDGGETWEEISVGLNTPEYAYGAMQALCVNPDNPDILYAAAGCYTRFISGPAALLISTDRGESWRLMSTEGIPDARVLDMACSRDYLYLATNDGVFRSRISDYSQPFSASAQEEQRLPTAAGDVLIIPAGALTEDAEITLSIVASEGLPDPPEGMAKIARAFDFGPDGTVFQSPVTLALRYEDSEMPEGVSEQDLVVCFYDSASSQWVSLTGVVDPEVNTITCQVDHFTLFAIMVPDNQPPQVEITSPVPGSAIEGVVPFSATASDNVKLWKVEFLLDGALLEADTVAPYVHSLDTGFVTPGVHSLTAIAYDTAGLTARQSMTVLVNTTRQPTYMSLEGPSSARYSDLLTLRATLNDSAGRPVVGREVCFSMGDERGATVTGEDGSAEWAVRTKLPAGEYPEGLSASFAGDAMYFESVDTAPIRVEKEDAELSYNGSYLSRVDSAVNLRAELRENDDSPGEIALAGAVGFEIYDSKGNLARKEQAPVVESAPGVGVAETASPPLPAGIYTVRTSLEAKPYYAARGDIFTELAVYDPQGGFTTGAGFLCDRALKTFAFVVKPSSCAPWLPKGDLVFVDHTQLFRPFRINATGFAWLVIPADQDIAYVAGTCSLSGQDGYTFNLMVEDKGCWLLPLDTLSLVVKDPSGAVAYEARGTISGGNIKIQR